MRVMVTFNIASLIAQRCLNMLAQGSNRVCGAAISVQFRSQRLEVSQGWAIEDLHKCAPAMSPLFHLYRVLPAVSSPPLPFLPVCSPKRAGQLNNWLLMSELSPVITAVPPYASEWCTSYKHLGQLTVFCSWITILSCHCCDLYRIQTGVPTPKISAVLG